MIRFTEEEWSKIKDSIMFRLGAPVCKVELDKQQLTHAVELAIEHVEVQNTLCRTGVKATSEALKLLVQEGALIYAKEMLGRIRSKYDHTESFNYPADGTHLLAEYARDIVTWKAEVYNVLKGYC